MEFVTPLPTDNCRMHSLLVRFTCRRQRCSPPLFLFPNSEPFPFILAAAFCSAGASTHDARVNMIVSSHIVPPLHSLFFSGFRLVSTHHCLARFSFSSSVCSFHLQLCTLLFPSRARSIVFSLIHPLHHPLCVPAWAVIRRSRSKGSGAKIEQWQACSAPERWEWWWINSGPCVHTPTHTPSVHPRRCALLPLATLRDGGKA